MDKAVTDCIRDGVLADVLSKHRAEVFNLILYEYDEQKQLEIERNEAREEGREEGRAEGRAQSILDILEDLGEVPKAVRLRISGESNLERLTSWLKLAAKVKTMEQFLEEFPE